LVSFTPIKAVFTYMDWIESETNPHSYDPPRLNKTKVGRKTINFD